MKKIALVALLILITVCLCGCSDDDICYHSRDYFKWAILQLGNGELIEGPVTYYSSYSNGIVEFTMNGIRYYTHYSNVILCTEEP